jgi:mannosyltransferase OCH1-like enzyme
MKMGELCNYDKRVYSSDEKSILRNESGSKCTKYFNRSQRRETNIIEWKENKAWLKKSYDLWIKVCYNKKIITGIETFDSNKLINSNHLYFTDKVFNIKGKSQEAEEEKDTIFCKLSRP